MGGGVGGGVGGVGGIPSDYLVSTQLQFFVVLLLGVCSLLGFDNSLHRKIKDCLWNRSVFLFHCCSLNIFSLSSPFLL